MLSPPEDLDETTLAAALTRRWGVAVASLAYRPVGFGSHHWSVSDQAGGRWFVTVDDLATKRLSAAEKLDDGYRRLGRSLDAARALRDAGAAFVVAPVPTAGGAPVARLDARYSVAVYPYVEGESFGFGAGYADDAHRDAVLAMVVGVHGAPETVRQRAAEDDFGVPHRDALEACLDGERAAGAGPYAERTADLVAVHAAAVRGLLARYDALAADAAGSRTVLTHGEPHPGNTLRTDDGWRLIDWDTVLVAPPERDIWMLDAEVIEAYPAATGVAVLPELLELYRLRWDIADLAVGVDRFRLPHSGNADDDESWAILERIVAGISS